MSEKNYQSEIERLEKELLTLEKSVPAGTTSAVASTDKKSFISKVLVYKKQILAVIVLFIFFIIVKPKCILYIKQDKGDPEMLVNKKKLFLYWGSSSLVLLALMFVYERYNRS